MVGVEAGEDMKFAAQLAQNNDLQLALIDKPLEKTIKNS